MRILLLCLLKDIFIITILIYKSERRFIPINTSFITKNIDFDFANTFYKTKSSRMTKESEVVLTYTHASEDKNF